MSFIDLFRINKLKYKIDDQFNENEKLKEKIDKLTLSQKNISMDNNSKNALIDRLRNEIKTINNEMKINERKYKIKLENIKDENKNNLFNLYNFKKDNKNLKLKINELTIESNENKNIINKLTKEIKLQENKINSIDSLEKLNAVELISKVKEQNNLIKLKENKLDEINNNISIKTNLLCEIKSEIGDLEDFVDKSNYGLYNHNYKFEISNKYKLALTYLYDIEKNSIKSKAAVNYINDCSLNNDENLGKKLQDNMIQMMIVSFNNECNEAIKKVNYHNYDLSVRRIKKSYEKHNKMNELQMISIKDDYLQLKLKELDLSFEYALKKEEEKELLREERHREAENNKLKKEIKLKEKTIEKDISHFKKAIKKLQIRQSKEIENIELKEEIKLLEDKISNMQEEKKSLFNTLYNAKAGYVYIISNVGSFGDNVFKIGVTRRLKPMDRIDELSSASVPFKFDVHAFIFSENAFELEYKLHQRFNKHRINLANNRKEFFSVSWEDIKDEINKYDNMITTISNNPQSDEYMKTLSIINSNDY